MASLLQPPPNNGDLFIDESFRGREGLFGLCDDFGVGSIIHTLPTI
jgi:hypothetical protein